MTLTTRAASGQRSCVSEYAYVLRTEIRTYGPLECSLQHCIFQYAECYLLHMLMMATSVDIINSVDRDKLH